MQATSSVMSREAGDGEYFPALNQVTVQAMRAVTRREKRNGECLIYIFMNIMHFFEKKNFDFALELSKVMG